MKIESKQIPWNMITINMALIIHRETEREDD